MIDHDKTIGYTWVYCSKTIDRDKTIGDICVNCSKTIDHDKTIEYTWSIVPNDRS